MASTNQLVVDRMLYTQINAASPTYVVTSLDSNNLNGVISTFDSFESFRDFIYAPTTKVRLYKEISGLKDPLELANITTSRFHERDRLLLSLNPPWAGPRDRRHVADRLDRKSVV